MEKQLHARVRRVIVGMDAQIWWRFGEFEQWPFRLVQMVDVRNVDQQGTADEFWNAPCCCKSSHFCAKVKVWV